jgi:nucleolar protein 53
MARSAAERELEIMQKKSALKYRLRHHGLAGQRLGRHKVPEGRVDVQLGEDLTETLRGLKVIGAAYLIETVLMILHSRKEISSVIDS